jgi:hypothetical protein
MDEEKELKPGRFAVSVSPFAGSQIRDLSNLIGVTPGRLIGQLVEAQVASPSFGAWMRRAKAWRESDPESKKRATVVLAENDCSELHVD